MLFIMKDGSTVSGTVDLETEEYYLVDEEAAFGDIIAVYKKDIIEIKNVK